MEVPEPPTTTTNTTTTNTNTTGPASQPSTHPRGTLAQAAATATISIVAVQKPDAGRLAGKQASHPDPAGAWGMGAGRWALGAGRVGA